MGTCAVQIGSRARGQGALADSRCRKVLQQKDILRVDFHLTKLTTTHFAAA